VTTTLESDWIAVAWLVTKRVNHHRTKQPALQINVRKVDGRVSFTMGVLDDDGSFDSFEGYRHIAFSFSSTYRELMREAEEKMAAVLNGWAVASERNEARETDIVSMVKAAFAAEKRG